MSATAYWRQFSHDADMGVVGVGATPAQAFEQAALAMTAVVTDPHGVRPEQQVDIRCSAPDDQLLLAEWLNALVYEMATRKMIFSHFEVHIDDHQLQATATGEGVDPTRHEPAVEVKGATYTELDVSRDADGMWHARCVVDV